MSSPSSEIPENPTATQCIEAILLSYRRDALQLVMTTRFKALGRKCPDDLMDTAKGRRKVYGWALTLADGVMD